MNILLICYPTKIGGMWTEGNRLVKMGIGSHVDNYLASSGFIVGCKM